MFRKRRKYTFLIRICFIVLVFSLRDIDIRGYIDTVQQTVQKAIAAVNDEYSEAQNKQMALEDTNRVVSSESAIAENAQKAQLVADLGIVHLFRNSDGSFHFKSDPSFFMAKESTKIRG